MEKRKDAGSAILFIVIAIGGLWIARTFNTMSAVFPILVLGLLLLFSVIYLFVSLYKTAENEEEPSKIFTKEAITTGIGLLIYVFLIWFAGFLLASLIFLGGMTWYLQEGFVFGRKRMMNAAGSAIAVTVVFFLLFRYVFLVQLPTGVFIQ
ncbi:tripartite tricarboxylate transporter TctB family protein [Salibacterium qingdaonense]|uniref:Tripartite tricarboxylate transporter TctB family protein n=1 Tax=Salibacterium qingdaonense TaxID=266892 RepID=A0A1I4NI51_9BACI|nr:tripartite tricarboxylate transporter TctB family protein [Salibacterium qingdaonense]SFM15184.1 Tripartite tricarboxylate transporter TctB family protein [Salibacterium qingdaonense]